MTACVNTELLEEFRFALGWADRVFAMLRPEAMFNRPILLRHPTIFYFGHLPAFAWNQVFRYTLGRSSFNETFDRLFERGIDPPDTGQAVVNSNDWPAVDAIHAYKRRIERELWDLLCNSNVQGESQQKLKYSLEMVLEHYLMHVETLLYMQHQLDHGLKVKIEATSTRTVNNHRRISERKRIPRGTAVLGAPRGTHFGWCNEFDEFRKHVEEFDIDKYPVTNGEFLQFVEDGGYERASYWDNESWQWLLERNLQAPVFWKREGDGWLFRGMFEWIELPQDWPVWVSKAEAEAFANWRGATLPTETQFHRAAYGTADGDRLNPWGGETEDEKGNFGLQSLSPEPVGSRPESASYYGVEDLVGNGWEWTSSQFSPFPGFQPWPSYPGYSADFFDGRHFVLKGASPVTAKRLVRRSFRNWYQAHYPYVYAKFRCVYRNFKNG